MILNCLATAHCIYTQFNKFRCMWVMNRLFISNSVCVHCDLQYIFHPLLRELWSIRMPAYMMLFMYSLSVHVGSTANNLSQFLYIYCLHRNAPNKASHEKTCKIKSPASFASIIVYYRMLKYITSLDNMIRSLTEYWMFQNVHVSGTYTVLVTKLPLKINLSSKNNTKTILFSLLTFKHWFRTSVLMP